MLIFDYFIKGWLLTLLLALSVGNAVAASAVSCHCFQDRAFSAAQPQAFDPYLLATTQNRLLAHSFALPRKEIVSAKMAGASGDQLWVRHWIAAATGRSLDELDTLYVRHGSWQKTVLAIEGDPELLGALFWRELAQEDEQRLAVAIVTQILQRDFALSTEELNTLFANNLPLKEQILAVILSRLKEQPIVTVLNEQVQVESWGALLERNKVSVETIETFLERQLRRSKPQ
ncbi:MAG: hypothetical protein OET90_07480 [Desulfuromonadales bacterium]|nr:hypothetical protein [Desulfuromonadales bacterium]